MTMKTIRTDRLILRRFREGDYDDLYAFLSQLRDDEFEPYPDITYENGVSHLAYRIDSGEFYAVELRETGRVIGNISFLDRDFSAKEVGFIIHSGYRGKGYALEALSAVIREAFSSGVHRVYAECDPKNTPSWRLMEKAGMKREAHFRQNIFFRRDDSGRPIWKDTYVYALLDSDSAAASPETQPPRP